MACVQATDRLVPEKLSWITAGRGDSLRFRSFDVEPGDHRSSVFGERFDALDQRGRALDTVVFRANTGARRAHYMPMPFASSSARLGIHVATSRRVWFDAVIATRNLIWIERIWTAKRA